MIFSPKPPPSTTKFTFLRNLMKLRHLASLCAALLVLYPTLATAQTSAVPNFISYQGRVVDAAGANVGTGTPVNRTVIFRIWDSPSSTNTANLIYSEAQTVTVSEGEFSVLVGQGVANPTQTFGYNEADRKLADFGTAFNGSARYLGVTVAASATIALTDNEITPRQQIVSTAFAMRAKFAESIGSSSDLTLTPLSGTASNYGLGWYGTGRLFGSTAVDGPVLYGNAGGALGSNASGSRSIALRWDASGRVGIGATSISSATNKLTLQGDMTTSPADQLTIRGNADNNKRLLLGYDTTANKASLQSYTALTTAGQLLLNPSGGNVGVNNTSPSVALDVTGAINASGAVTGGSISTTGNIGIGTTTPVARLDLIDGVTSGTYGSAQISRPATGHTGSHLAFVRAGGQVMGLGYAQSSSTFGFGGGTSGAFSPSILSIDANGKIGIGTTAPANLLQVQAPVAAQTTTNTVTSANAVAAIGASDTALHFGTYNNNNGWGNWIQSKRTWDAASFPMAINPNGGNVGIGLSYPQSTLDVGGNANVRGQINLDGSIVMEEGQSIYGKSVAGTTQNVFWPRSGNGTYLNYGTSGLFIRNNNSTQEMYFNGGRLAVGTLDTSQGAITTTSTGFTSTGIAANGNTSYAKMSYRADRGGIAFDVYNTGQFPNAWRGFSYDGNSDIDWYSDRSLKKDIVDAEPMLERLMQVQFRRFRWKDISDPAAKPEFGVIAQEVEPLFPDLVATGKDGLKTVGYTSFATITAKALQEYKTRNDADLSKLNAQVQTLQEENAALRRELAAKDESLEARMIALERRMSKDGATETVSLETAKTAE